MNIKKILFSIAVLLALTVSSVFAYSAIKQHRLNLSTPRPDLGKCTHFLTAQHNQCLVTRWFRCEGLGEMVYASESFDEGDQLYLSFMNRNLIGIYEEYVSEGIRMSLDRSKSTSIDDKQWLEGKMKSNYLYYNTNQEDMYRELEFFDKVTEISRNIDGYEFFELKLKTTENFITPDTDWAIGSDFFSRVYKGRSWYSKEMNIVLWGDGTQALSWVPNEIFEDDHTPIKIMQTDDDGFQSKTPIYGCED